MIIYLSYNLIMSRNDGKRNIGVISRVFPTEVFPISEYVNWTICHGCFSHAEAVGEEKKYLLYWSELLNNVRCCYIDLKTMNGIPKYLDTVFHFFWLIHTQRL